MHLIDHGLSWTLMAVFAHFLSLHGFCFFLVLFFPFFINRQGTLLKSGHLACPLTHIWGQSMKKLMGNSVDIDVFTWSFILGWSGYALAWQNPQEFVFSLELVRFSTHDSPSIIHGGVSLADSILRDEEEKQLAGEGTGWSTTDYVNFHLTLHISVPWAPLRRT